jgi:ubiquinone/menaquinone biosynthesis C-methylase UbiE
MENRIKSEAKFWNSVATKYDGVVEKRFPKAYKFIFEHIAEDIQGSKNLLEIATGTGIIAIKLSSQVPRITAIDIAPQMLEVARKKCAAKQIDNIAFKFGDACALEFGDKTFDTIIASNVVHLLHEPEMAFREMKRVLKDHGKIIVPTFCHGANLRTHLLSRLARLAGQKTNSRWSLESYKKFVEQNGFTVTKDSYLDGTFPLTYLVAEKTDA